MSLINKSNDLVTAYMEYTKESESPKRFLLWSALCGISAAAQRKIWIDWGDLRWDPNIFVILAGPPATRKTTAMRDMRQFLIETGIPMSADSITREKFIRRLGESTATVITENGNFLNHCSFALWSSELSTLINKSTEQLLSDLTDLYDAPDKWEYDTKHQGTDAIYGCYITLLAATTPTSFRHSVPVAAVGSGFTSRVIFVCAKAKQQKSPCPLFASSIEGQEIKNFIMQRLLNIYSSNGVFKGTKEFAERYINLYAAMPDSPPFDPDNFSHYWDRRMQNLMKVSMLYALSRGAGIDGKPHVLEVVDFDRALETLKDAETEMPLVFADFGRSKVAWIVHKVLDVLKDYKNGMSLATLTKRMMRDVTSYELSNVITTLESAQLITTKVTSGGTIVCLTTKK